MARHIQELLAATDFNYLKLKQLYFKGGSVLSDELSEAFGDKDDVIPPGERSNEWFYNVVGRYVDNLLLGFETLPRLQ